MLQWERLVAFIHLLNAVFEENVLQNKCWFFFQTHCFYRNTGHRYTLLTVKFLRFSTVRTSGIKCMFCVRNIDLHVLHSLFGQAIYSYEGCTVPPLSGNGRNWHLTHRCHNDYQISPANHCISDGKRTGSQSYLIRWIPMKAWRFADATDANDGV